MNSGGKSYKNEISRLDKEMIQTRVDLIGQRFGKLIVLEQLTPGPASKSDFRCQCDCGNEVIKSYRSLRCGVKSCDCISKSKQADLTGRKFGTLTVLEYIPPKDIEKEVPFEQRRKNSYGGCLGMWKCRCECGNTFYATTQRLLKGHVTSCGCKKKREDLTGKRFGRLVVLEEVPAGDPFYKMFKKTKSDFWKCQCDCGKITYASRCLLEKGRKISCGCYQSDKAKPILKIAQIMRGDVDGTNVHALQRALDGKKYVNNESGCSGVYQLRNGKYRAQICFRKKNYHLGYYDSIEDAVEARKSAELVLYKGFLEHYESDLKDEVEADISRKRNQALKELKEYCRREHRHDLHGSISVNQS